MGKLKEVVTGADLNYFYDKAVKPVLSQAGSNGMSIVGAKVDPESGNLVLTLTDDYSAESLEDNEEIVVTEVDTVDLTLSPNVFYRYTSATPNINITLATDDLRSVYTEYMLEFVSGETATVLTFAEDYGIKWMGPNTPDNIAPNMVYQVSILNGIGIIGGVSNV